jgi:N-acetylglucosaminyldiphosphoundecaprenol N-acetyl-beta-D-mannosaminyltransferase
MKNLGTYNVLGLGISAVDYAAAVQRIIEAAQHRYPLAVSALAVHGVMTGVFDDTHRYRLNQFDLLVPDGQPLRWALNWLYHLQLTDRVYGPALMTRLCERAAAEALPIFLYGSTNEVLTALSENLQRRIPGLHIAGVLPSRFRRLTAKEHAQCIAEINASGARLTFVGLGCPRQEIWTYECYQALSMPVVAVGAAFPFHADILKQAPDTLQRLGLEWLYRLYQEPRRLWKRYILLNPVYLALLALQLARLRTFESQHACAPTETILYG